MQLPSIVRFHTGVHFSLNLFQTLDFIDYVFNPDPLLFNQDCLLALYHKQLIVSQTLFVLFDRHWGNSQNCRLAPYDVILFYTEYNFCKLVSRVGAFILIFHSLFLSRVADVTKLACNSLGVMVNGAKFHGCSVRLLFSEELKRPYE